MKYKNLLKVGFCREHSYIVVGELKKTKCQTYDSGEIGVL